MGKPTTEEYAKQFTNVGLLEKMGIEIKDGMSIGVLIWAMLFEE